MIRRVIEDRINSALANKKAVAIMGASQVGKSTLAASVIPGDANILEINGNSTDVQTMFANIDESKMRILIGNNNFLFVDEAHKIENVGNMLKLVVDKFPDIKIVVTGSSAFKLAAAVNASLAGHKRVFKLYPLSFKEMADTTSVLDEYRMLEHRLVYGYYPEVVTSSGCEKEVIKELIDSFIYKDIIGENHIFKQDKLIRLIQALAFQIGSTISANELAGVVGVDAKTVDRYIDILEKNYIVYTLPVYSENQRNELKFARKVYFWDMGIRNGVIGNMAPVSLRSPEEFSRMWENFIVTERIKRNEYAGRTFVQHYFWRTQQKKEVALVEIEDGVIAGFEIKNKSVKKSGAASKFLEAYPNAKLSCVTPGDVMEFLM